jgi:hypothetical protein
MTTAPGSLLPVAVDAVALASDLVRTRMPGLLTAKGDRDMSTEVDYAVERAVRDFLHDKTPDIAFLGEEEGATGAPGAELLWALDPIDGTANFVHGIPLCGISLGLVHRNRPVVGVIDLPFPTTPSTPPRPSPPPPASPNRSPHSSPTPAPSSPPADADHSRLTRRMRTSRLPSTPDNTSRLGVDRRHR